MASLAICTMARATMLVGTEPTVGKSAATGRIRKRTTDSNGRRSVRSHSSNLCVYKTTSVIKHLFVIHGRNTDIKNLIALKYIYV